MSYEIQDRREHPRGDGVVTKIEDLTYSVLRRSVATDGHAIDNAGGPSVDLRQFGK